MRPFMLASVALALVACAQPRYTLVRTAPAPSRSGDCVFDVLTVTPQKPFQEIAMLESETGYATNLDEFRASIAPKVCDAGGDAVIAHINDGGYYRGGTIIRFR